MILTVMFSCSRAPRELVTGIFNCIVSGFTQGAFNKPIVRSTSAGKKPDESVSYYFPEAFLVT